jgi:hypothetical protein
VTTSDDELDVGADLGMVRMICTDLFWRKVENENERGRGGAQSDALRSFRFGLWREIRRRMPMGDIRCTGTVREIKSTKGKINSLNGFCIENGITFVLIVSKND